MKKLGIHEILPDGSSIVLLFDNEEELNYVWNQYTAKGRRQKHFKKCNVDIEFVEGV